MRPEIQYTRDGMPPGHFPGKPPPLSPQISEHSTGYQMVIKLFFAHLTRQVTRSCFPQPPVDDYKIASAHQQRSASAIKGALLVRISKTRISKRDPNPRRSVDHRRTFKLGLISSESSVGSAQLRVGGGVCPLLLAIAWCGTFRASATYDGGPKCGHVWKYYATVHTPIHVLVAHIGESMP